MLLLALQGTVKPQYRSCFVQESMAKQLILILEMLETLAQSRTQVMQSIAELKQLFELFAKICKLLGIEVHQHLFSRGWKHRDSHAR